MRFIYGDDARFIFRFLNGFFFVFVLYKSSSIFILGNSLLPILSLFYRRFHVFFTIAICIYLCFAEKVLFRFLALVSSVIGLEYQTRQASYVKKVSSKLKKKNLETIFPALQNWNVLHWTFKARGYNLQIILDSGKNLSLKTWPQLIIVCKIKRVTQF